MKPCRPLRKANGTIFYSSLNVKISSCFDKTDTPAASTPVSSHSGLHFSHSLTSPVPPTSVSVQEAEGLWD